MYQDGLFQILGVLKYTVPGTCTAVVRRCTYTPGVPGSRCMLCGSYYWTFGYDPFLEGHTRSVIIAL